ncbi:MAG: polysaccharide biosynthesis tyrosine autokinase [Acidobacteria bacterium]|nr:polysaccharide biosynthesis tyrosine autokinase [Acidobacteriota bacterium]
MDSWRILWGGRTTVLTTFIVIVTVGMVGTFLQAKIYRAAATLEIHARAQKVAPVADVSQIGTTEMGWSAEDRYFKTQLEVLKSRDVAERAFDQLGLKEHPRFKGIEDPVGLFAKMLEIEPVADTGVVRLAMEGPDREETAAWVNAVADAYVQRNMDQAVQATRAAVDALLQEMEPWKKRLADTESKKFAYARDQKVFVPEVERKSYDERLSQLEKDATTTQLHRLQLEAVFQKIKEIEQAGGTYQVIPQVAEDQVLRDLNKQRIDLETELKRLLVTYKPGHFKVKEISSELDKLKQKIDSETERIISAIRTDYSLTQEREKDLRGAIDATKNEALTVSEKASGYTMLETEAAESKRIYDLMTGRIKEVDLNAALIRNNVSVLDHAIVPRHPERPKKLLNLLLSIFLGLGVGVGLVFFLEYVDATVRSADMVERELGLRMLAIVPTNLPESAEAANEAFQSLRLAIQIESQEGDRRVLLVTSAAPAEGKSTVAAALARSLARGGDRVCLVDADLRRPSLHTVFSVPSSPGLGNVLAAGEAAPAWRTHLRDGDVGGLKLLPCGSLPPNPPELIASERFSALVKILKSEFDWVVIDSPPVVGLVDAVHVASLADLTLLVIRHASTDRDLVKNGIEGLRRAGGRIAGAVLNDVDITRGDARSSYGAVYYPSRVSSDTSRSSALRRPAAL